MLASEACEHRVRGIAQGKCKSRNYRSEEHLSRQSDSRKNLFGIDVPSPLTRRDLALSRMGRGQEKGEFHHCLPEFGFIRVEW